MKFITSNLTSLAPNQLSAELGFFPQPNLWVNLRDRLSPYSFDQALLLCETETGDWVAWVPEFGETILGRHQFFGLD